jgi:hypothetical protein
VVVIKIFNCPFGDQKILVVRFGDQKLEIGKFWSFNSTSKFSVVKKNG